jgi:hypothetical protein
MRPRIQVRKTRDLAAIRKPPGRQLKRLGLYAEDLSRRDSVKVAQYEVLGNDAKRHVRPVSVRDDRNVRLLVSHAARRLPAFGRSSHPGRIALLKTLTQHFVLGYFR